MNQLTAGVGDENEGKIHSYNMFFLIFFFQAEDGIRDGTVTGVQTCALPISAAAGRRVGVNELDDPMGGLGVRGRGELENGTARGAKILGKRLARENELRRVRSEERRVGKECRSRGVRDD